MVIVRIFGTGLYWPAAAGLDANDQHDQQAVDEGGYIDAAKNTTNRISLKLKDFEDFMALLRRFAWKAVRVIFIVTSKPTTLF